MVLTAGAVTRLNDNDTSGQPAVQIVDHKILVASGGGSNRHRLVISDGQHFMHAMLVTQLNYLVDSGTIRLHCVLALNECIVNLVQGRMVVIILNVTVMEHPGVKLGNPSLFPGALNRPPPQATELQIAHRRLAAVTVTRQVVPEASGGTAAATLARPIAGLLSWLPVASYLAWLLEPRFLRRVAHVFQVDSRFPRATAAVVSIASHAHAALSASSNGADLLSAPRAPHTPLSLLDGELLCVLAESVGRDSMLPLAFSCLAMRDAIYITLARQDAKLTTSIPSAVAAGRTYLSWAVRQAGCPIKPVARIAASAGSVECIEWALSAGECRPRVERGRNTRAPRRGRVSLLPALCSPCPIPLPPVRSFFLSLSLSL